MHYTIINQDVKLLTDPDVIDSSFPYILEYAGRVCTATEDKVGTGTDTYGFLKKLINSKHMSVFEHCSVTVELTTSRAISHQLVRHRIAAYSQQSMRYVKFTTKDSLKVIKPQGYDEWSIDMREVWEQSIFDAVDSYERMIILGATAEVARGVLPHDTATKLVATWNLRELLHILYDPHCGRYTNKHAQAQVRQLMRMLRNELASESVFMQWLFETYEKNTDNVQ
jgi:thymidylate synthase (FAD)